MTSIETRLARVESAVEAAARQRPDERDATQLTDDELTARIISELPPGTRLDDDTLSRIASADITGAELQHIVEQSNGN